MSNQSLRSHHTRTTTPDTYWQGQSEYLSPLRFIAELRVSQLYRDAHNSLSSADDTAGEES